MIPPWRQPTLYVTPTTRPSVSSFLRSTRTSIRDVLLCADIAHQCTTCNDFEQARAYANAISLGAQITLKELSVPERDAIEGFLIRTKIKDRVEPSNLSPEATMVFHFIQAVKQHVDDEERYIRKSSIASMLADLQEETRTCPREELQRVLLFLTATLCDHGITIKPVRAAPAWFDGLTRSRPKFCAEDVFWEDDEDSMTEPSPTKRKKIN